jgi:hypothetical protein
VEEDLQDLLLEGCWLGGVAVWVLHGFRWVFTCRYERIVNYGLHYEELDFAGWCDEFLSPKGPKRQVHIFLSVPSDMFEIHFYAYLLSSFKFDFRCRPGLGSRVLSFFTCSVQVPIISQC